VRIGIDFDNTVVSYDELFHRVALERDLVPRELLATKLSVRDYLRQAGKEDIWTAIQGYVYGARMEDAVAYPGVMVFFAWARAAGVSLAIVSHRTRHPFLGHPYDLHEAARGWVNKFLVGKADPLIQAYDVYFELTKSAKLARIAQLDLDYFIDDLPEILLAEDFPGGTGRILFDPDGNHPVDARMVSFSEWDRITAYLEGKWKTQG
jgi:hypothetical protein